MDESSKLRLSASKDTDCAREPSFIQKRKQSGHEKKLTHLTEYQNNDEIPTNKALLYKAGYRRVHFDMPTEYRMQYCCPRTEPSPVMKASGTHTQISDNSKKNKYKHAINGAHVDGYTHKVLMEPPLKRGDHGKENIEQDNGKKERLNKGLVSNGQDLDVHELDENSKPHKGKSNKSRGTTTDLKMKPIPVSHSVSNSEKSGATNNKQLFHVVQQSKTSKGKEVDKKNGSKSQCPDHSTEYQMNFNREYSDDEIALMKKELREGRQGIGFKDHVKDIIYLTRSSHPTATVHGSSNHTYDNNTGVEPLDKKDNNVGTSCIIPHNHPTHWVTEYSSNFGSPLQMKYVNGIWQGVNRPETLIKSPRIVDQQQHQEIAGSDPPYSHSSATSWFDQVLELRKKVKEFKFRGCEGTDPLFESRSVDSININDMEVESIESSTTTRSTEGDGVDQSSTTSDVDSTVDHPVRVDDKGEKSSGPCQYPNCTKCLPKEELSKPQTVAPGKNPIKQQYVPRPVPDRLVPSLPLRPKPSSGDKMGSSGTRMVPPPATRSTLPTRTAPKQVSVAPKSQIYHPTPPPSSLGSVSPMLPSHLKPANCKTCGATPTNQSSYVHPGDCAVCNYSSAKVKPGKRALSPSFKKSIPICPPSCPNSTNSKMESFSLSPVSVSSSCSVASEILERAKQQRNIWKY